MPVEHCHQERVRTVTESDIGISLGRQQESDDLGMAVANSLAGVRNGARQVECAVNGMGERAGNAALEEIVMGIRTRPDFFSTQSSSGLTTNINTKEIFRTSQLVSQLTGFVIQPNKAIVGANAFAHESGVHVDGVLKSGRPTRL